MAVKVKGILEQFDLRALERIQLQLPSSTQNLRSCLRRGAFIDLEQAFFQGI